MGTTAIADLVCAVFIAILYARHFSDRRVSRSNRLLNLCLMFMLAFLLIDAAAYILVGPDYPLALRFLLNLISFTGSCVIVIIFTFYLESVTSENKSGNGKWYYLVLKIIEFAWFFLTAYEFISGHLITYDESGIENLNYAFPAYIYALTIGIQLYLLVITVVNVKSVSARVFPLLCIFEVSPVINTLLYGIAGIDLAYALGAVTLGLIAEFVQKKQTQDMINEQRLTRELADQQRYIKAFGDMVNAALWTIRINDSDEILRIYWSDEVRRMLGYEATEEAFPNVIGSWTDKIHPDDRQRVMNNFNESLKSRDTENFVYDSEFRMQRKTGEYCWYHAAGRMENDTDGTRNFFGIVFDITADKRLKEQLALSDGLAREYHTVWLMDGFGSHNLHLYRSTGKTTVRSAVQLGLDEPCFDTSVVKYIRDNVPEEDQERVIEETRFETIERETPETGTYTVTYRRYTADRKDYTYHQMCFARAAGSDGALSYILAYRDVDRMMKEQLAQQKRLKEALDAASIETRRNDILIDTIKGGKFNYSISADDKVTGAIYAEISRKRISEDYTDRMDWIELLHPEDRERVLEAFMACVHDHSGNTPYNVTFRMKSSDGGYRWVQSGGKVIRKDDGSGEFYGISLDITEQMEQEAKREKNLEDALAKAEEESVLRSMVYELSDSSPWIYEISPENEVLSVSYSDKLLRRLDNESAVDPMGWLNIVHPEDRERVRNGFMAAILDRSGNTLYDESYRFVENDGEYRWVRSVGKVIRRQDGSGEFAGMATDYTAQIIEREKQQKELEDALNLAEVASKAKTDFLFNMSHDIRTPMNAIIGFTNIAKKEIGNPEKAADSLDKVLLSSEILLNLINDVLDMSRIESGKVELHEEKYEIKEAFDSFEPAMSSLAASKDIDLKFSIGNVRNRFIFADGSRFDRVLINIISNAIKYTPPEGFVKVTAEQTEDTRPGYGNYRFTVADSGIGMSEEFQKHMFEDFTREENSTTSGVQGTGLGLALAKKLTDLMGGTISCVSTQGIGTTFTLDFPFRLQTEEDISEKTVHESEKPDIDLRGKKALLVEDNELNREIADEILSAEGIIVETAADGQKAVNRVRERGADYYDFILMDIQMPVMNGYEATKTIHTLMPDFRAPVIALSANAFAEDRQKSLDAGMDAHVAKPINIGELLGVLARFM